MTQNWNGNRSVSRVRRHYNECLITPTPTIECSTTATATTGKRSSSRSTSGSHSHSHSHSQHTIANQASSRQRTKQSSIHPSSLGRGRKAKVTYSSSIACVCRPA